MLKRDSLSSLFRGWLLDEVYENQSRIIILLERIMTTLSEVAGVLGEVQTQLVKARDEILQRIADLEAALQDTPLPETAEEALSALRTTAQALDDIVPDVVPPPAS